jgi:hypothetical protein
MSNNLNWTLNFKELGLGDIAKQLQGIQSNITKINSSSGASKALGDSIKHADKLTGAFKKLAAGLEKLEPLAQKAGLAFKRLGEGLIDVTKDFVKEFAEKEKELIAYRQMLGSSAEAKQEYNNLNRIASLTGTDPKGLQRVQEMFIKQGLRGEELNKAMLTTVDFSVDTDPNKQAAKMKAIGTIYAKAASVGNDLIYENFSSFGKLQRQLFSAGINAKAVFSDVGKQMGLKSRAEVEQAFASHQVRGDVLKTALQNVDLQEFGTSKLGEYAALQGQSVSGMLMNILKAPMNLIKSIDESTLTNWVKLKEALSKINEQFLFFGDLTGKVSDKAQAIKKMFGSIADFGLGIFTAIGEGFNTFITEFARSFNEEFSSFGMDEDKLEDSTEGLSELFSNMAYVAADILGPGLAWIIGELEDMSSKYKDMIRGLAVFATEEEAFMDGLWGTIKNFFSYVGDSFMSLGRMVKAIFSLSPSEIKKAWAEAKASEAKPISAFKDANERRDQLQKTMVEMWNDEDAAEKKKREDRKAAMKAIADKIVHKDHGELGLGGSGKGGKGGGGGGNERVWTFTPNYGPASIGGSVSMPGMFGGADGLTSVIPSKLAGPPKPSLTPTINVNIYDARNADEVAQKVRVEVTRVLGRLTTNPGPAVM